jgi:hypothetical protein
LSRDSRSELRCTEVNNNAVAIHRYLQRHIEPLLPEAPQDTRWQHVTVIPAYDESPSLLQSLRALTLQQGDRALVILVLNRPDNGAPPDCNHALRTACQALPDCPGRETTAPALKQLHPQLDLLVHDMEQLCGATPAEQGVGLARKTGCDIALAWIQHGAIDSQWIFSTDADTSWPTDYFYSLATAPADSVAATLPFRHIETRGSPEFATTSEPSGTNLMDATEYYETRLHHYVLGLEYAGSPYAWHTLGSCLAFKPRHYAAVRGFPKRSGAEDFYLLNKLSKLGTVYRSAGHPLLIQARPSHRVPFGTGPAVRDIMTSIDARKLPLYYHPGCFTALRAALHLVNGRAHAPDLPHQDWLDHAQQAGTVGALAIEQLLSQGGEKALAHCARQSASSTAFLRHFHQWFDGFRTLKFIHAMRDSGLHDLTLTQLEKAAAPFWPAGSLANANRANRSAAAHWQWQDDTIHSAMGR